MINELLNRRGLIMGSGSAIDWETIAKGMIDCTTEFNVPAEAFGSLTAIPSGLDMFRNRQVVNIEVPATLTSLQSCFKYAPKLKKVTYLGNNYSAGAYLFQSCTSIEKTTDVLPPNLASIPIGCFMYDTGLLSVVLPEGVTLIGSAGFIYTNYINQIDLPSTLTTIEANGFNSATNRSSGCEMICRATTPPTVEANGLLNNNFTAIYVPDASVSTYQSASGWSDYAGIIKPISQRPT